VTRDRSAGVRAALAAVVLAVAAAATAAACGDSGEEGSAGTTTSPPPPTTVAPPTSTSAPATGLFDGVWPFSSQAEVDAYLALGDTAFADAVATAAAFAESYVGIHKPVTFPPATAAGALREVKVGFGTVEGGGPRPDPQPSMSVFLRDVDGGDNGPWTVVRANAADIVVDKPAANDRISSPAQLRGTALAFEGHVNVDVRQDGMVAGQSLGEGSVTGGGGPAAPFSGTIAFRQPSKPGGAVVFFERSAADGQGVLLATVVRVGF
jgi:hypothetical protein